MVLLILLKLPVCRLSTLSFFWTAAKQTPKG